MVDFGEKLKRLRSDKTLSQGELAKTIENIGFVALVFFYTQNFYERQVSKMGRTIFIGAGKERYFPALHPVHYVGFFGYVNVVRHNDDAVAVVMSEPPQDIHDVFGIFDVEISRRLVSE